MDSRINQKKINIIRAFSMVLYEALLIIVVITGLVFYGPFSNIRKTVVESAMTSLKHKYIVQIFLSNQKINEILRADQISSIQQNKKSSIQLNSVHDSTIERFDLSCEKFKGYMLIVHDPTRLRVGYTDKMGVEGQRTSEIAISNSAVAAINAGGFVDKTSGGIWTGTGGKPSGLIISNGVLRFNDLKSETQRTSIVGFTDNSLLLVGKYSLKELKQLKVKEAVNFGPALIVNGKPAIKKGDGGWGIAPRTAVGQRKDGAILLLVIDGRQLSSIGATLRDVQEIMLQYGAVNASNLDGGSSSTMYFNGKLINNPCDSLGERSVPTVFMVK